MAAERSIVHPPKDREDDKRGPNNHARRMWVKGRESSNAQSLKSERIPPRMSFKRYSVSSRKALRTLMTTSLASWNAKVREHFVKCLEGDGLDETIGGIDDGRD